MTEEAFRHAAHTITRDHAAPAAVAIYSGAVAAAIRRSQVAGSAQLSPMLLDELSGDRLAHRAAVEIGPVGCLVLETWICEMWEGIEELAAEAVPPTLTNAERMYRRATIELLTDADLDTPTATLAFAATLAIAFVRWNAARSDPAAAASSAASSRRIRSRSWRGSTWMNRPARASRSEWETTGRRSWSASR
ncbi:hypothetical protein [Tsukamurella tyrosinosolvens]|uniref:hypothetical protein n=1 Tax=Tsukamurella tyrosinosolvens TaxID=57704 RepID=UPI003F4A2461